MSDELTLPLEVRSGPKESRKGPKRSEAVPKRSEPGPLRTREDRERRARELYAERPEATSGELAEATGLGAVELVAVLHPDGGRRR